MQKKLTTTQRKVATAVAQVTIENFKARKKPNEQERNEQVEALIGIKAGTVRSHINNIYKRLCVHDISGIVMWYVFECEKE